MKGKNNQLFRIILSLSPTEKAYFKKYGYKTDTKNKDEFILFDIADNELKQDNFSENTVEKKFAKKLPKKNYNLIKSRLLQNLLESLTFYDKKNSGIRRIYEYINMSDSLQQRELFDDTLYLIEKAEKLAIELEQPELLLLLFRKKMVLYPYISKYKSKEKLNEILGEYKQLLDTVNEQVQVISYVQEIVFFQKNIGVPRNEEDIAFFNRLKNHTFFNEKFSPQYSANKLNLAVAKSSIVQVEGKADKALQFCLNALNSYNPSKEIAIELENRLVGLYDTLLQSALLSFNLKEFELKFEEFSKLKLYNKQVENLYSIIQLYVKSMYAIIGNKLNLFISIVSEFDKHIDLAFVPNFRKVSLAYYTVLGPFFKEDYDTAYKQIQWLKNNRNLGIRYDIEIGLYAMEAIILFENEEFDLLSYQMRSFYEYLKNRNRKLKMEIATMNMLNNLMKIKNKHEFYEILKESWEEMKGIVKNNPNEALFLNSFDSISWLQSKLEKETFYKCYYNNNIAHKFKP